VYNAPLTEEEKMRAARRGLPGHDGSSSRSAGGGGSGRGGKRW